MIDQNDRTMSPDHLGRLGDGRIAYLRPMMSEQVHELFPEAPDLAPGMKLWALLSAEGRPIMLTDSRDVALANARENDLETLSLH